MASLPFPVPTTPRFDGSEAIFARLAAGSYGSEVVPAAQRAGLLNNMLTLINASAVLKSQLWSAQAVGFVIDVNSDTANPRAAYVDFGSLSSPKLIVLPNLATGGGFGSGAETRVLDPRTGGYVNINPAGQLVGVLSHEVFHANDFDYAGSTAGTGPAIVLGVFSESKATLGNIIIGEELRQANGGVLPIEVRPPNTLVPSLTGNLVPDTREYYNYVTSPMTTYANALAVTAAALAHQPGSVDTTKPYFEYYGGGPLPLGSTVTATTDQSGGASLRIDYPDGTTRTLTGPAGRLLLFGPENQGNNGTPPEPMPVGSGAGAVMRGDQRSELHLDSNGDGSLDRVDRFDVGANSLGDTLVEYFKSIEGVAVSRENWVREANSGRVLDDSATFDANGAKLTEAVSLSDGLGHVLASTLLDFNGGGNRVIAFSDVGGTLQGVGGDGVAVSVGGLGTTIHLGAGAHVTDAGTGNTIVVGSNSTLTVLGSGNHDVAGAGSIALVEGNHNGLIVGANSTLTLAGHDNAGNAGPNSTVLATGDRNGIVLHEGGTLTLSGADQAAQLYTGATATITAITRNATVWSPDGHGAATVVDAGHGDHVTLGEHSVLTVTGTGNTGSVGAHSRGDVQGSGNVFSEGADSYAGLSGTGNIGYATGDGWFNLGGAGQTAHVADGGHVGVVSGAGHMIDVDHGTVVTLDGVGAAIVGSGNVIQGGANSRFSVEGDHNALSEGTGSFTELVGTGNTGTASGTGGFNLKGHSNSASVGDGAYVGIVSGHGNVADVDHGTVVTLDGVSVTVIGSDNTIHGGNYSDFYIAGNRNSLSEGTGSYGALMGNGNSGNAVGTGWFNIAGDANSAVVADGSYVGVVSGHGNFIVDNYGTVGTQAGVSFTLLGSGTTVNLGDASGLDVHGSGNTINAGAWTGGLISGGGNTLNELGVHAQFNLDHTGGANNVVLFSGAADQYAGLLGGAGYVIAGTGGTVHTWDNTTVIASGDYHDIHLAAGDHLDLTGIGNVIHANDHTVGGVTGSGNTIFEDGAHVVFNVRNTGTAEDHIVFSGAADQYAGLQGGDGYVIDGIGGVIATAGYTSLAVGGDAHELNLAAGSHLDLFGSGNTIHAWDATTGGITGTNNTLNEWGTGAVFALANVGGGTDTVNFNHSGNTAQLLGGSGYTVTGAYGHVVADVNTSISAYAHNLVVDLASGDVLGIVGGYNTINTVANTHVYVSDTGGGFVDINSNGNAFGGHAVNGFDSGIYVGTDARVNLHGFGNYVDLGDRNTLGAYGGGNTIKTGQLDFIVIGETGGAFDTVNGSYNTSSGFASDDNRSGIYVQANAQVNLNGSWNSVYLESGDTLGAYGGGNDITAVANDLVVIGQTNGNFDTVHAQNVTGNRTAGNLKGIFLQENAQANVSGENSSIFIDAGDTLGLLSGTGFLVTGSNATINTLAGTSFNLDGSNNDVGLGLNGSAYLGLLAGTNDRIYANNDIINSLAGTSFDLFGSNVTIGLGLNGSATLNLRSGTEDVVYGSNDSITSYAGTGFSLIGDNDTVRLGLDGSAYLGLVAGVNDTVWANNSTINTLAGTSLNLYGDNDQIGLGLNGAATLNLMAGINDTIYGSNDIINTRAGSSLNLFGSNDVINLGTDGPATLNVRAGTGDRVNGNNNFVNEDAGAAILLSGTGNHLGAAAGSSYQTTLPTGVTDDHHVAPAGSNYSSYDDFRFGNGDYERITNFGNGTHLAEVWNASGSNGAWNKLDVIFKDDLTITFSKQMYANGSYRDEAYGPAFFLDRNDRVGFTRVTQDFDRNNASLGTTYTSYDGSYRQYAGANTLVYGVGTVSQYTQAAATTAINAFYNDDRGRTTLYGQSQIGQWWQDPNAGFSDVTSNSRVGGASSPSSFGGSLGQFNGGDVFFFAYGNNGGFGGQGGVHFFF